MSEPEQGGSNSEQGRFNSMTPSVQQACAPEKAHPLGCSRLQPPPGRDGCGAYRMCADGAADGALSEFRVSRRAKYRTMKVTFVVYTCVCAHNTSHMTYIVCMYIRGLQHTWSSRMYHRILESILIGPRTTASPAAGRATGIAVRNPRDAEAAARLAWPCAFPM